jgi:hypothetical protein
MLFLRRLEEERLEARGRDAGGSRCLEALQPVFLSSLFL